MERLKIKSGSRKRLGRGYGSGKGGHTVGRGQKGQKARGKIGILFEGVKVKKSFFKRTPFLRGKGRNKPSSSKPLLVKLSFLNNLENGEVVDKNLFIKKRWLDEKDVKKRGVKIVYDGEIKKRLIFRVPVTSSARKSIESAGGKVLL